MCIAAFANTGNSIFDGICIWTQWATIIVVRIWRSGRCDSAFVAQRNENTFPAHVILYLKYALRINVTGFDSAGGRFVYEKYVHILWFLGGRFIFVCSDSFLVHILSCRKLLEFYFWLGFQLRANEITRVEIILELTRVYFDIF